jgi:hypothetical protein
MATAKKNEESGGLRVTAPLVQIRVGDRILHMSQGDVVPDNASQESLDHLRSLGFVSDGSESSDEK